MPVFINDCYKISARIFAEYTRRTVLVSMIFIPYILFSNIAKRAISQYANTDLHLLRCRFYCNF
jgi:hypothetical protein